MNHLIGIFIPAAYIYKFLTGLKEKPVLPTRFFNVAVEDEISKLELYEDISQPLDLIIFNSGIKDY